MTTELDDILSIRRHRLKACACLSFTLRYLCCLPCKLPHLEIRKLNRRKRSEQSGSYGREQRYEGKVCSYPSYLRAFVPAFSSRCPSVPLSLPLSYFVNYSLISCDKLRIFPGVSHVACFYNHRLHQLIRFPKMRRQPGCCTPPSTPFRSVPTWRAAVLRRRDRRRRIDALHDTMMVPARPKRHQTVGAGSTGN